jgi:hypothetical protein
MPADVDVVHRPREVGTLGEAHELDAVRRIAREVGFGDAEHYLVLTRDLSEATVLHETERCGVSLFDPAPQRAIA